MHACYVMNSVVVRRSFSTTKSQNDSVLVIYMHKNILLKVNKVHVVALYTHVHRHDCLYVIHL